MAKCKGFESTTDARSRNMAAIKGRHTQPEMIVRRLLCGLGYRYRLHRKDVPGNPDIAFLGRKKAIFVHGCFWHQHSGCGMAHSPRSRREYWEPKLTRNVERDAANIAILEQRGWKVLVLWECEIKRGKPLATRLMDFVGDRPTTATWVSGHHTTQPLCKTLGSSERNKPDSR